MPRACKRHRDGAALTVLNVQVGDEASTVKASGWPRRWNWCRGQSASHYAPRPSAPNRAALDSNSLLNGELSGNFPNFGLLGRIRPEYPRLSSILHGNSLWRTTGNSDPQNREHSAAFRELRAGNREGRLSFSERGRRKSPPIAGRHKAPELVHRSLRRHGPNASSRLTSGRPPHYSCRLFQRPVVGPPRS